MREPESRTLPIGATCQYYARGDMSRPPCAAIVTYSQADGVLDLTLFRNNSRVVEPATGIRHKDDPWLKTRPKVLRSVGCWDFVESLPRVAPLITADPPRRRGRPRDRKPQPAAASKPSPASHSEEDKDLFEMTTDEENRELVRLYGTLGDGQSVLIAEKMSQFTGVQWTYQKVNIRLRGLKSSNHETVASA